MSGYDEPWRQGGLRADGYWNDDPRNYRNVPGNAPISGYGANPSTDQERAAAWDAMMRREAARQGTQGWQAPSTDDIREQRADYLLQNTGKAIDRAQLNRMFPDTKNTLRELNQMQPGAKQVMRQKMRKPATNTKEFLEMRRAKQTGE